MHVLLIHQAFAAINEPGGTRHHELGIHLAQEGHQVTIITSPVSYLTGQSVVEDSTETTHERIVILRPPVYEALHRSFGHRVLNFFSFMVSSFFYGLKVKNVDLVWGTSPPIFQGVTAWMLARLKRVPFLFEIRDLWPAFAIAIGVLKSKILINASQWLERFLYQNADQVVVNSPGFVNHVTSRGAKSVETIPNGSDTRMFRPESDGSGYRLKHQLVGKFVALYAGAHGMSNDLDVLISAADKLREVEDLAIVLVGDGKEKPNLQQRSSEIGLENVIFLPPVPKVQMAEALAAADVCIAILKPVELYRTVYPNKVFDYMAAGRPVILAIDGVIREVVESAQAGRVVPPGNVESLAAAIRYYVDNPAAGVLQGKNGRHYIETHFDRSILADHMLKIMLQTIQHSM
jgi:glycosyltransferase involved in cell wall biosynthesis